MFICRCDTVLNEFLRSINRDPSLADFNSMITVLILHAQMSDELIQVMYFFKYNNTLYHSYNVVYFRNKIVNEIFNL